MSRERAERRHYRSHLRTSAVLLSALTGGLQLRAVCPERAPPVKLPKLPERKKHLGGSREALHPHEEGALLELDARGETWCQLEVSPGQSWDRTAGSHYPSPLETSAVLLSALAAGRQLRAACPERAPPVRLPKLPERKAPLEETFHGHDEGSSGHVWERAERRHYRGHLRTSAVLLTALTGGRPRRAACPPRALPIKLPERRHFPESYKCHL